MEAINTQRTSSLPKDTKIFFISDHVRGKSAERDEAVGIHGVTTAIVGLRDTLQRTGYTNAQIMTGQDFKHLVAVPRTKILLPINPSAGAKRISTEKPDVVAINVEGPLGIATFRRARRLGTPIIAMHTTNVPEYIEMRVQKMNLPKPLKSLIERRAPEVFRHFLRGIYNDAELIRVSSENMREKVTRLGIPEDRIFVMSPGVDRHIFKRPEKGDKNPYDICDWYKKDKDGRPPKVILYTGRISHEKSYQELIDIAALVDPNHHIVFIGPPTSSHDKKIIDAAQKRHPNFHWLGTKELNDLAPYYGWADVFVTPSMSETYGLTPDESMACGTPVVVAENQVMATRVTPGVTGTLYPSGDRGKLLEATRQALSLKQTVSEDVFDREAATFINPWDRSARIFLQAAEEAIERKSRRSAAGETRTPTPLKGKGS